MQKLTASVTAILLSFSTSIVSSLEELNLLANISGFAGVALTITLIYKNIEDAQHTAANTRLLKLKARREATIMAKEAADTKEELKKNEEDGPQ